MPVLTFPRRAMAVAISFFLAGAPAALAGSITVEDAYMRVAGQSAKSGAAFMQITNIGAEDDRLLSVASDAARKVELHRHVISADGIAQMQQAEDGFAIPAGATHPLERGGDHVMFMGLSRGLTDGDIVTVILQFEAAGEIVVEIPVDNDRTQEPAAGSHRMKHDD